MKNYIVLFLLSGFLLFSSGINAQTPAKAHYKGTKKEWRTAHNGKNLSVTWRLTVRLIYNDEKYVWCWLNDDIQYKVDLYKCTVPVHTNDVLIVTGQTAGVSESGDVILN